MHELPENLPIRSFRLEASYTATRLNAVDETRHLARDFEEAADKFALLEEEESWLDTQRMETQAMVEAADDAWDDMMHLFRERLLDIAGNDMDHELYRKYFSEIPSHVTTLSYHAEILISKDLERALEHEEITELKAHAERLRSRREPLERLLLERTRLEVEEARFANRVALAKAILNKIRRIALASLEEVARGRGRSHAWCLRFFHTRNANLERIAADGVEIPEATPPNGGVGLGELPEATA